MYRALKILLNQTWILAFPHSLFLEIGWLVHCLFLDGVVQLYSFVNISGVVGVFSATGVVDCTVSWLFILTSSIDKRVKALEIPALIVSSFL